MIVSASGSDYKPVPEGTYTACCIRVIDLGTQVSSYNGKEQRKVLFTWEVPEVQMDTDDGPMPATISTRYTASLHEKAALRKVLESWRGKTFTADELAGFDLKNVLGAGCLMGVIHNENGGTTYANVSSVMALPKGMERPKPVHPLIEFSLDDFSEERFDALSPKMRELIAQAPEYKRAMGQEPEAGDQHQAPVMDDEIPF